MNRRSFFTRLFAIAPAAAAAPAIASTIIHAAESQEEVTSRLALRRLHEKVLRGELLTDSERQWVNRRIDALERELKPFYSVREANWDLHDRLTPIDAQDAEAFISSRPIKYTPKTYSMGWTIPKESLITGWVQAPCGCIPLYALFGPPEKASYKVLKRAPCHNRGHPSRLEKSCPFPRLKPWKACQVCT